MHVLGGVLGRRSIRPVALVSALALTGALSACTGGTADPVSDRAAGEASVDDRTPTAATPGESGSPAAQPRLRLRLPRSDVPVDTLVEVGVVDGSLTEVTVTGGPTPLPGHLAEDGSSWQATERLEPGTLYTVRGLARNAEGGTSRLERTFRTTPLTLAQQTYPSIAPLDGETVGVGMPVIVTFDLPVTRRAAVERRLSVASTPKQPGSWHWISDSEVHWRPKAYWRPGTEVRVDADVNGLDAGNGIYGQQDRSVAFTVGDKVVMKVDVAAHRMRVLRNGELLRTLPVSAGKAGFTTRSGIKVIIEKFRYKDMDAATTGITEGEAEYYNIENVEYAQRVTYSGEFLHAAPWSVGSQGSANVSHGCVGMSTADAGWLYSLTRRGDVVDVTGSSRRMEPTNGFGDWNVSWDAYRAGSALS